MMTIFDSEGNIYEDLTNWHLNNTSNEKEDNNQSTNDNKKIYFVRHGDTDLNKESSESSDEQPVRGWSPIPLNQDGIKQAQKAAESVKDLPITHIESSDLPRARQTANIIGNRLDITPEFNPGLRTWNLGEFTGKAGKEVHDEVNRLCSKDQDEAPKGGESFNQFKDRILSTMSDIVNKHKDHELLVISHNSPERVLHAWTEAGQPQKQAQEWNGPRPFAPEEQKEVPNINIPEELLKPNLGKGPMFGPMIDYMQKEYKRLELKPGHHFKMNGTEYEILPPEISKDTDWDFIKVPEPAPEVG